MVDDPLWYQHAIIYQLHVRAFYDSNGDGIGDFRGLTQKLDYLQDLGITALWLLPFYPSPLRDDGYDIADYTDVNPRYGTLAEFKELVAEAHARGMKVVTELVLNHTSDQHEWFQRSRRARPGSKWRDFYVWSDTTERYTDTRIIFKDFEPSNWTWDPVAKAWYWHRFFHHQPDLNFDNPAVHQALFKALDFWLKLGVDGVRLDAVPYLYEREGTSCENLPETHQFLKKLRAHVDEHFPGRMLLAEANQWPEDAIEYFGDGDECHMAFHFPVMPRLFMAVNMENRMPIVDIMRQTPPIPATSQWATFLRNHDELTLEMVTDEERDYMWRTYAHEMRARINLGIRRRLAPLLGNDRRKIELLNVLLFSLPGTPIVYYGDEIGMGDNIYLGDRDGCRTPMQWNADRNAGFSRCNPQQLFLPVNIDPEYRFEGINVDAQRSNPASLLWWMRRLIHIRQQFKVFGTGSLEFLEPDNAKVLAFVRASGPERVVVAANLSRFAQHASLDLSQYAGMIPREIFGSTRFPAVGDSPYAITLGPYAWLWLSLEPERPERVDLAPGTILPSIRVERHWTKVFEGRSRIQLASVLSSALAHRRWYAAKGRVVQTTELVDAVPITADTWLGIATFTYTEGEPDTYALPLSFAAGEAADRLVADEPGSLIARLQGGVDGVLYDASMDPAFGRQLLQALGRKHRFTGGLGDVTTHTTPRFRAQRGDGPPPEPNVSRADQSNTSILYGDRFVLKLYRRLADGDNPELEVTRWLTDTAGFAHTAPVAGWLEYRRRGASEAATLGLLTAFVPNQGDAWRYTLDAIEPYLERVLTQTALEPLPRGGVLDLIQADPSPQAFESVGPYLADAALIGRRTAEMHLALASATDGPLAPEPFTPHYQRALYQSMRNHALGAIIRLRRSLGSLPADVAPLGEDVARSEALLLTRLGGIKDLRIRTQRLRIHGDFHLGQVLWTGRDFVIIDFEGEPGRPVSERRIKQSPLRDVAGMLRSFHYAANLALHRHVNRFGLAGNTDAVARLERGAKRWYRLVSGEFLRTWFEVAGAALAPPDPDARGALLEGYLLDKAVYELLYELDHRPELVHIPLVGLLDLLETPE